MMIISESSVNNINKTLIQNQLIILGFTVDKMGHHVVIMVDWSVMMSVGEWMHLTVCPLYGPGHDSSVGEWMYLIVCPLRGPGSIPSLGRVFQGIIPGISHVLPWTQVWEDQQLEPPRLGAEWSP